MSLLKDEGSSSPSSSSSSNSNSNLNKIIYDKIKVDNVVELNYEKLAEDSFKAELDETVKLESDKILSGVKSEPPSGGGGDTLQRTTLVYSNNKIEVVSSGGSGGNYEVIKVANNMSASNTLNTNTTTSPSSSTNNGNRNSKIIIMASPSSSPPASNSNSSTTSNSTSASATTTTATSSHRLHTNTASIMSQHGNKRLFKCGFCSTSFQDTYRLERHVKSEHRDITDRAKYETFPWQEPGKAGGGAGGTTGSGGGGRSRTNSSNKMNLFIDPSQHIHHNPTGGGAAKHPNILSKLKLEPPTTASAAAAVVAASATTATTTTNIISNEYILCQVCSKIFISYKDFNLHMNDSLACKNATGGDNDESCLSSNDVLVILSPDDSLKFTTGETILNDVATVVENNCEVVTATATSAVQHHQQQPTAVYECHLCRALFATTDYLKRHLDMCQNSSAKRRKN